MITDSSHHTQSCCEHATMLDDAVSRSDRTWEDAGVIGRSSKTLSTSVCGALITF